MTTTTEATVSRPIADLDSDGLLGSFPDGPRLVGTKCDRCGRAMIGVRVVCSACVSTEVGRIELPTTGSLYTFTRLHVGGDGVRILGYVDLDGDVRTLADIRENGKSLQPGMQVALGVDGADWFFAPVSGVNRGESDD